MLSFWVMLDAVVEAQQLALVHHHQDDLATPLFPATASWLELQLQVYFSLDNNLRYCTVF